jgi:bifunctional ADP-heptose synthase (sugar kinase/adenylyltransferase)
VNVKLKRKRVVVVGDIIIDEYTHGRKLGVSAETPTVVGELVRVDRFMGGAGLVARHLTRFGVDVDLVSLGGLEGELPWGGFGPGSVTSHIPGVPYIYWRWTQKKRYYIDDYKMVQYDILNEEKLSDTTRDYIMSRVKGAVEKGAEAIVICDNGHGTVNVPLMRSLVNLVDCPAYVDCQLSQKRDYAKMIRAATGCHMIFMNQRELATAFDEFVVENHIELAQEMGSNVVYKKGADGFEFAGPGNGPGNPPVFLQYPGIPVKTVDTCGAGDALMAAVVAIGDMVEANRWAALSTTYKGTVVPRLEEL